MKIRPAEVSDYVEVAQLVNTPEALFQISRSATFPWSVAQLEDVARQREALTVCVHEGKVIGFANLYQVQAGQSAFIGNVVVSESYRGHGFGKRLLNYMIALIENEYRAEAHLSVFGFNTAATMLYKSLGFLPYDVEATEDYTGKKVTLIHMKKAVPCW
ncbi:GNAT family N-acetyltransferase [Thaumasiovibrio subtropicus]|uniref:GNAT family N-acetyltransferase n=1 Tax=Thaumasiovibrio subtropicus TaxID=1891207 RepID=UPI000B3572D9|nr:GNAT family N-acetyltransferase [Thaumasiovibrio subtropicus]